MPKKIVNLDSLWFQISDKKNGTNERILIDISFIPNDLKILDFLGSGQKNIGFSNPNTKIHQLPFYQLIKIGLICFLIAPLSLFVLFGKKLDKFLYFFLGINLSKVRNFFRKKVKSLILK